MRAIDVFGSEVHFQDHLRPVYQALPYRGEFFNSHDQEHDNTRPVVVASYGDLKRVRKMGYTKIARFEHGAGQNYGTRHGSYAGGKDADDVSLFLVPNQYSADLWQQAYPNAQVEIVGCPKLDYLPRKERADPPTACISFHWDCYLVPETVGAFEHYRHVLKDLAGAVNLIGHGHPRAHPLLERRYRRLGIPFERSFEAVCKEADLYICDNSSSLYEFAATGRPVVVLNQPLYRKDVHHGLRFWDAIPGIQVDHPKDLIAAVQTALEDPPELQAVREHALDIAYIYRTGAAERAAEVLTRWA
jgi:hypothetical protein